MNSAVSSAIFSFNVNASLLGPFSRFGTPNVNSQPYAIVQGPDGALWFTEASANHIGRISTSGAITEFPIQNSASRPTAIISGADGMLWSLGESRGIIGRISTSGEIRQFDIPTANS